MSVDGGTTINAELAETFDAAPEAPARPPYANERLGYT